MRDDGLSFEAEVPPGGYHWWYVDAISDDRRQALSVIAFIGSVFSPYYAWSGRSRPRNHVAINVALYTPRRCLWAMTERGEAALDHGPDHFQVGRSRLDWDGTKLTLSLDEITAPIPQRLKGTVTVQAAQFQSRQHVLDAAGRHRWGPIAPCARIEVDMLSPATRWSGHGYVDNNGGDEPMEQGFQRWDWSRAALPDGDTAILYNVTRRDGTAQTLGLRYSAKGEEMLFEAPPEVSLPRTFWRLERRTQTARGAPAKLLRTVEDSPFYARSVLSAPLLGEAVTAMHESLDLDRFRSPVVRALLPWRMPRGWWWG